MSVWEFLFLINYTAGRVYNHNITTHDYTDTLTTLTEITGYKLFVPIIFCHIFV